MAFFASCPVTEGSFGDNGNGSGSGSGSGSSSSTIALPPAPVIAPRRYRPIQARRVVPPPKALPAPGQLKPFCVVCFDLDPDFLRKHSESMGLPHPPPGAKEYRVSVELNSIVKGKKKGCQPCYALYRAISFFQGIERKLEDYLFPSMIVEDRTVSIESPSSMVHISFRGPKSPVEVFAYISYFRNPHPTKPRNVRVGFELFTEPGKSLLFFLFPLFFFLPFFPFTCLLPHTPPGQVRPGEFQGHVCPFSRAVSRFGAPTSGSSSRITRSSV
jgi:hypothetical protein